jgi:tRNA threonylcarbamoyladenosine biosynthesis protein TsaE
MTIAVQASSPDETRTYGRRFAALLTAGDVVVLSGRLGSGKTLFVSGVAEGLGITERVTSPTFVIAKSYRNGFLPLFHADVYRLGSISEFDDLGLIDEAADGALLIEWGTAVADAIPASHLTIHFEGHEEERTITFEPAGAWCERNLEGFV